MIVPAFTFFATAEAVSHTGATPVFADVERATFNLDPKLLSRHRSGRTKAVIAVHLFGQSAPLDAISEFCRKEKLVLIEDCAQSLGADYDGRPAGSWGEFGCFSFYPTKNAGAVGDAGMITTTSAAHDATLRMLRHHGSRQTYLHERVGWNSRLDEVQAAVLRVKLRKLDEWNGARARVAALYRKKLAGADVVLPQEHSRGRHAWHQFTIRSESREAIRAALAAQGMASSVFYPLPLHRQPAYEPASRGLALPEAEAAARTVLSLPIHPLLDDASVERVCAAVRTA